MGKIKIEEKYFIFITHFLYKKSILSPSTYKEKIFLFFLFLIYFYCLTQKY